MSDAQMPDSTVEEEERLLLEVESDGEQGYDETPMELSDSDIEVLSMPSSPAPPVVADARDPLAGAEPGTGSPVRRGEPPEEDDFELVDVEARPVTPSADPDEVDSRATTPRPVSPNSQDGRVEGDLDELETVSEAESSSEEEEEGDSRPDETSRKRKRAEREQARQRDAEEFGKNPYYPLREHEEVVLEIFRQHPELEAAFRKVEANLIDMARKRPCMTSGSSMCIGKIERTPATKVSGSSHIRMYELRPATDNETQTEVTPRASVATQTEPAANSPTRTPERQMEVVPTSDEAMQTEPLPAVNTTNTATQADLPPTEASSVRQSIAQATVPSPRPNTQDREELEARRGIRPVESTPSTSQNPEDSWDRHHRDSGAARSDFRITEEDFAEIRREAEPARPRASPSFSMDSHQDRPRHEDRPTPNSSVERHTGWMEIHGQWVEVLPRLAGCFNCGESHHYRRCQYEPNIFCFRCGRRNITLRDCPNCSPRWRQEGPYVRRLQAHVPWTEPLPYREDSDEPQGAPYGRPHPAHRDASRR